MTIFPPGTTPRKRIYEYTTLISEASTRERVSTSGSGGHRGKGFDGISFGRG